MSNEWDRASLISQRVIETTGFGEVPRAGEDYWKFILTGAGLCKEMSIAGTNLMSAAGLIARRVVFPGENHALIEVKIGGDWWVSDPGYYSGELVSRTERAKRRIERVGSLTYVVAYTENGFIELTQQYVPTDTIVIRITRNGEPFADAQVVLKHKFRNITTRLPCDDRSFHTDVNGTVTIHMGKPLYINEFKESEEYYWIYVNGENTGRNIASTETGRTRLVQIDVNKFS
jgi:hypothetical protein